MDKEAKLEAGQLISGLKRENFQAVIQGKETDLYTLTNSSGMEVCITNYGGAIMAIMVPDREGRVANVIQGHDSIQNMVNSPEPFLSTLVGRYGNRIAKGHFVMNGKGYSLAVNNGPNHLHGGPTGFHARVWDAEQINEHELVLRYISAYYEEGFPGELHMNVKYSLTEENELIIDYRGTTNKKTPVNMTSHGFFSLAGIANPTPEALNNILTINADFFIPIDETSIPTGEILKVEGTPFDFRTPHAVGERIGDTSNQQIVNGTGYDHCFVLNKREPGELSYAVKCNGTGRAVLQLELAQRLYRQRRSNLSQVLCPLLRGTALPRQPQPRLLPQHHPQGWRHLQAEDNLQVRGGINNN